MNTMNKNKWFVIGLALYIVVYAVDRFVYHLSDCLYIGAVLLCLILLAIGYIQGRKEKH